MTSIDLSLLATVTGGSCIKQNGVHYSTKNGGTFKGDDGFRRCVTSERSQNSAFPLGDARK